MKKMIKFFSLFLVLVFIVSGCGNDTQNQTQEDEVLISLTYEEFNEKLDNGDTFILEVVQDGCPNCTSFTPKFKDVLSEYSLVAFSLNITELSTKDSNKFLNNYSVDGTPTVMFFKDGKETSTLKRLVGNKDKDIIISKLKNNGYIEE